MSEFSGVSEMFGSNDEPGLLDTLGDISRGAEEADQAAQEAFQNFKEKIPDSLSDRYGDEIKYKDGKYHVQINGADVDLDDLKNDYVNGDYRTALEKMGISSEDLDSADGQEFLNGLDKSFDNSTIGKVDSAMDDARNFADKSGLPEPKNWDDFKKICEENGWDIDPENEKFKSAQENIKSEVGDNPGDDDPKAQKTWAEKVIDKMKGALDWFKDFVAKNIINIVLLAILIMVAKDLYHFIKSMQHALSGCFATGPGNYHCKIYALTCSDDDIHPGDEDSKVHLCYACEDLKCDKIPPSSYGGWIPLKLTDQCTCDPTGKSPYPGVYNPDADTGKNSCGGRNPGKCPVSEEFTFVGADTPSVACNNASGCVARKEACAGTSAGKDCSDWCDSSKIHTRQGQKISCQQCSFWCAFGSTLGDFFHLPSDLLGKLEKILLWIGIFLIVIIVGYWILKKLFGWGLDEIEGKKNSSHQSIELQINRGSRNHHG